MDNRETFYYPWDGLFTNWKVGFNCFSVLGCMSSNLLVLELFHFVF